MHICIIGTGTSGWMCCNLLKNIQFIDKITVVGSPHIPPIGVGESNTLLFVNNFLNPLISNGDFTLEEFIIGTDAVLKYGVNYINWSKKHFINHFKNFDFHDYAYYGRLLANKDPEVYIHDLIAYNLTQTIFNDHVSLDGNTHPISYHFDAGKFIDFFSQNALKNPKVEFLSGTVNDVIRRDDDVQTIFVDGVEFSADYYVFATGDTKLNEDVLGIKYEDLSDVLLTNKAVVYPLKYTNKREQFHPYTKAKTMKHGWRWITPTWSRIGTGYVFSTNHVSIDEAVDEFLDDIGDKTIEPIVVNFNPKYNKTPFHENYCTLGMAQGFLEPLDAPGITATLNTIESVINYLAIKNPQDNSTYLEKINELIAFDYKYWCSFILCQYKTCHRNDTDFWRDHKLVKYDFYDIIMSNLDNPYFVNYDDILMFHQTIASKDVQWKTNLKSLPYKIFDEEYPTMHHLDYIKNFHEQVWAK